MMLEITLRIVKFIEEHYGVKVERDVQGKIGMLVVDGIVEHQNKLKDQKQFVMDLDRLDLEELARITSTPGKTIRVRPATTVAQLISRLDEGCIKGEEWDRLKKKLDELISKPPPPD